MPLRLYAPGARRGNRYFIIRGTVSFWKGGRRHSHSIDTSTKTTSRDEAEGIRRQIEAEILERNTTGRDPVKTFGQLANAYLSASGSPRFLEKVLDHLEHRAADDIDDATLKRLAGEAYPQASAATIKRQWYTPILAVLNHGRIRHDIERPRGVGKERTHFFTPVQADRLIKAISGRSRRNPWIPVLAEFLFGQGCRVTETILIDAVKDVYLDHNIAILRDTKSDYERRVTLTPRTVAALSTLPNLNTPGPLFRKPGGRIYARRQNRGGQMRTIVASAVEDIGLDPTIYTPHTFRHSWATWFYAQTFDVIRLMDEGGWRSEKMVRRYVKLASPSIGEEARELGWNFGENIREHFAQRIPGSK